MGLFDKFKKDKKNKENVKYSKPVIADSLEELNELTKETEENKNILTNEAAKKLDSKYEVAENKDCKKDDEGENDLVSLDEPKEETSVQEVSLTEELKHNCEENLDDIDENDVSKQNDEIEYQDKVECLDNSEKDSISEDPFSKETVSEEEVKFATIEKEKIDSRTNVNYKSTIDLENVNPINDVSELTQEQLNEIKSLNLIHTTWRDYTLMLLNSTADPLRSIWREKVVTSMTHWNFHEGSISEGNIAGTEVLSVLPSDLTKRIVDDSFEVNSWKKIGRLAGSKRMKVFLGNYPQESIANEANLCLKYIVKNWDKYGHLIFETPLLKRMWDLAQESNGKCVIPDEVLTYILEKPVNDSNYGVWIDVSRDVFTNGIPSDKYEKYWKNNKIEGFPLAECLGCDENGNPIYKNKETGENLSLDEQKERFLAMCDVILKEDISMSPCWKKIAICILKNDVSMKYAGFGSTLRERQARENALAAFSTKQEEKEKAKKEAERLAAQIERDRKATGK